MRNSFAALPRTLQQYCSTMQFRDPAYLRRVADAQDVSAHHSRVDHDVAAVQRDLLPAAQHRQRRLRLSPGRREKGRAAGAAPREGSWAEGKGGGQRSSSPGRAARPAGHRHSRLGGIGLLSVLGAGGQGAGLAAEAVGQVGGHGQLGRSGGHHGGLRATAPAPSGPGAPEGALTASVSRATAAHARIAAASGAGECGVARAGRLPKDHP